MTFRHPLWYVRGTMCMFFQLLQSLDLGEGVPFVVLLGAHPKVHALLAQLLFTHEIRHLVKLILVVPLPLPLLPTGGHGLLPVVCPEPRGGGLAVLVPARWCAVCASSRGTRHCVPKKKLHDSRALEPIRELRNSGVKFLDQCMSSHLYLLAVSSIARWTEMGEWGGGCMQAHAVGRPMSIGEPSLSITTPSGSYGTEAPRGDQCSHATRTLLPPGMDRKRECLVDGSMPRYARDTNLIAMEVPHQSGRTLVRHPRTLLQKVVWCTWSPPGMRTNTPR